MYYVDFLRCSLSPRIILWFTSIILVSPTTSFHPEDIHSAKGISRIVKLSIMRDLISNTFLWRVFSCIDSFSKHSLSLSESSIFWTFILHKFLSKTEIFFSVTSLLSRIAIRASWKVSSVVSTWEGSLGQRVTFGSQVFTKCGHLVVIRYIFKWWIKKVLPVMEELVPSIFRKEKIEIVPSRCS